MKIDKDTVKKISHLARLELDESKSEEMAGEMSKILGWMEKLNEVDTSTTAPLIHISTELNVLRNDEIGNMVSHERALKNAPKKDSNYFRVPKVIE